jgi:glutaredoxin
MGEDEMKNVMIALLLISVLALSACSNGGVPQEKIDSLAQCLTEKGTVMYGAFWCPHCAKTKKNFGPSFKYIEYVECDPRGENEQSELCLEKKIEGYDTWEFADGSRVIGEPTFETLAEKSGCEWSQS